MFLRTAALLMLGLAAAGNATALAESQEYSRRFGTP
jgi:hypothetical protein